MDPRVLTARRIILAIVAMALGLPVVVIATFHINRDQEGLGHQLGRFALTLLLCVFLFRGANWARLVTGVVFVAMGIRELLLGFQMLSADMHGLILIVTGSICLACAYVLFFVPIVREYYRPTVQPPIAASEPMAP